MKNKRFSIIKLSLASFCVLFTFPLTAQNEFGIKGGVLFSGINKDINSTVFDFETRTGFAAGFFFKAHNFLGPVGFQTELLYQLKGGDYFIMHYGTEPSYGYGGYNGGYGYLDKRNVPWLRRYEKYHYLSLPLLVTFSPFKFLDVYAGPEAGYMISSSDYLMSGKALNRFSAGVTMGFAVKISDNTKLDVRYSEDITRVLDFGDTDLKNYSFTVGLQKTLFGNR